MGYIGLSQLPEVVKSPTPLIISLNNLTTDTRTYNIVYAELNNFHRRNELDDVNGFLKT
jgi:hypothetical protein